MDNLPVLPPSGGSQDEKDGVSDSRSVTRESIISQINKIYNTISNTYSFRVIRQYCKGFKPNILLQTLIRLVSSLQEGLKYYPMESLGQEEETPYFTPIDDFNSYISFDVKVQNIKLFCSRMEQGISNFSTIITSSKKSDFLLEINTCYSSLLSACNDLSPNNLTSEKICIAIHSYEKLREVVNKVIAETASSPTSPVRARHVRRRKSDDQQKKEEEIKVLSADEVLNLYSKTNLSFITVPSSSKDQYWTKQSQSYSENLEKNLHQLLYMFSLKREFDELSASLHILQNTINETNEFPIDNPDLDQTPKKRRRKRKKSDTENEDKSSIEKVESDVASNFPFAKKPPITKEIINDANYVKWAEANMDSSHPRILPPSLSSSPSVQKPKRRKKRKSSNKPIESHDNDVDEDFEEFAKIVPAKSISQRHMRPYETISRLEFENKKLEDLIRQCPHKPDEVKQLREENNELTQQVRSLTRQLDELESLLLDEEEKFYE